MLVSSKNVKKSVTAVYCKKTIKTTVAIYFLPIIILICKKYLKLTRRKTLFKHTCHFNCHFPGKHGLASCHLIHILH